MYLTLYFKIYVLFTFAGKKRREYLPRSTRSTSFTARQQEPNSTCRKQLFKQKLKEADERTSGTGRENKLESLRELVGGGKTTGNMAKGSTRDWLDPHCHESQFEKWNPQ